MPGSRPGARRSTRPAGARPAQTVGEISGEAFATMVTGQKVRWVLDLMRGTEFAGRTITSYEITDAAPTRTRSCCKRPGRATRTATSPSCASSSSELGERGDTASLRLLAAPLRRVLFDTGEIPGFGWSCFTSVDPPADAETPRARSSPAGTCSPTSTCGSRSTPPPARTAIETETGLRVAGLGRLVDGGDGGDTYNYSPPAVDRVIDSPDAVRVTGARAGPVRARCRSKPTTRGPRTRSATSARARRAATRRCR